MRIVLDANVFISAAISPQGTCGRFLVCILENPQIFELILSEKMIQEISATLQKPRVLKLLKHTHEECLKWLEDLSLSATIIPDFKISVPECRDPDDVVYLAAAQCSKAELIISGDKDLLVLESFSDTKIISPSDFSFIVQQLMS